MTSTTGKQKLTYKALAMEAGIDRPPMNQKQYEEEFGNHRLEKRVPVKIKLKKMCGKCCIGCSSGAGFCATLLSFFPILSWLPAYSVKENLLADMIGGFTTGIMHIPQGLAYSVLAGVDPVYGLYSSCFPAFFYMIFGTSRHVSIGSFAVVTLMAGIANDQVFLGHSMSAQVNDTTSDGLLWPTAQPLTAIQVASSLTLTIGLLQMLCGVLRLEFLSAYFSDPLVSGFTTGASVHVLFAQLDDILGIKVPKSAGPFYLFRRAADLIRLGMSDCNMACILVSGLAISFLYSGKTWLSPYLKRRYSLSFPIPYELILVIVSTACSFLLALHDNYQVPVVGYIPTGLPIPTVPRLDILPECLVPSLGMVVVTIAVHISMAKMLAKKLGYTVDSRQELYAIGASSLLGSLFSVYPVSTALGRTMVNVSSGTKTQLSTVFSCLLLSVIILWMGSLLNHLPMCILASIILVALKSMFEKTDELKNLWKISRVDMVVWLVAFFSTVIIDVMQGLAISILFALLTVIFRSQWLYVIHGPKWESVVGLMTSSDDSTDEAKLSIIDKTQPSVAIFRFDAPLLFTNVERFMTKGRGTLEEWNEVIREATSASGSSSSSRFFIIDCSSIAFIDFMGAKALQEIVTEMTSIGVTVYLAAVKRKIIAVLEAQGLLQKLTMEHLFPTLHDAITLAHRNAYAAGMLADARQSQLDSAPYLPPPLTPTLSLPQAEILLPQTQDKS